MNDRESQEKEHNNNSCSVQVENIKSREEESIESATTVRHQRPLPKTKEELLNAIRVKNPQEIIDIANVVQRSQPWFDAREDRMTGSNIGKICGHAYRSSRYNNNLKIEHYTPFFQMLNDLVSSEFQGNEATEHGTATEPEAFANYCKFLQKNRDNPILSQGIDEKYLTDKSNKISNICFNCGLLLNQEMPWLAGSPDGITYLKGLFILLEIKCPFYKSFYDTIPHAYYDQIQMLMALFELPYCDFLTYGIVDYKKRPPTFWNQKLGAGNKFIQLRRFAFDSQYWFQVLLPRITTFYYHFYIPAKIEFNRQKRCASPSPLTMISTPVIPLDDTAHTLKTSTSSLVPPNGKNHDNNEDDNKGDVPSSPELLDKPGPKYPVSGQRQKKRKSQVPIVSFSLPRQTELVFTSDSSSSSLVSSDNLKTNTLSSSSSSSTSSISYTNLNSIPPNIQLLSNINLYQSP